VTSNPQLDNQQRPGRPRHHETALTPPGSGAAPCRCHRAPVVLPAADLGGASASATHRHHLPLDTTFWNGQIAADALELQCVGQDPRLPRSLVHVRSLAATHWWSWSSSISLWPLPRSPGRRCSSYTAVEFVLQLHPARGAPSVFARFSELNRTEDASSWTDFYKMYVFSWLSLYFLNQKSIVDIHVLLEGGALEIKIFWFWSKRQMWVKILSWALQFIRTQF
jgi:hypothetical protein